VARFVRTVSTCAPRLRTSLVLGGKQHVEPMLRELRGQLTSSCMTAAQDFQETAQ
jgi:hypothetical protein